MSPTSETIRPIGGFFGLGFLEIPLTSGSIWQTWLSDGRLAMTAWTARAALGRLIEASSPKRVWMPSYMCREMVTVAPKAALRFYALDDDLSPDVAALAKSLRAGDLVLGVNYFGWFPKPSFIELTASRPDVVWIEDRSHCLWTEQPPWAPWILYSPRKLVGVADGGILIGPTKLEPVGTIAERAEARLMLPELMRFEDGAEVDNANWYAAFKAREAALSAAPLPISRTTVALLQRLPLKPLVEARQRNFQYLAGQLHEFQAWPRSPAGIAPFGLPIAVHDAEALGAALARERLFCSRHWPPSTLAVDEVEFPKEHRLARRLLTLPCDHRYDEPALARLVEAVRRLAPAPATEHDATSPSAAAR